MSIKDLIKGSRKLNPHPDKFPDYIIDHTGIWGWFMAKPLRGKSKNHLDFQIGTWVYSMCLLKQIN